LLGLRAAFDLKQNKTKTFVNPGRLSIAQLHSPSAQPGFVLLAYFLTQSKDVRLHLRFVLSATPFTAIEEEILSKQAEDMANPADLEVGHRRWHGSKGHIRLFLLNQKLS
jgi:hypothetical protein